MANPFKEAEKAKKKAPGSKQEAPETKEEVVQVEVPYEKEKPVEKPAEPSVAKKENKPKTATAGKSEKKEEKIALKEIFEQVGFSAVNFTDSRNVYQFYPLNRLWDDIEIALREEIRLLKEVSVTT